MRQDVSKKQPSFIDEVIAAIASIRFGSIEIYVQDGIVTQLTVRNIKKTKVDVAHDLKTNKSK